VPEEERQGKLSELYKLCGTHKLIPDSMKLQGYGEDDAGLKEYKGPSSVHQNKFKGRKVAIKVTRVYISQKLEDPLGVSIAACPSLCTILIQFGAEVLQRGCLVETPPPPEHFTAPWCDNHQE
jgi:hypothetical protein